MTASTAGWARPPWIRWGTSPLATAVQVRRRVTTRRSTTPDRRRVIFQGPRTLRLSSSRARDHKRIRSIAGAITRAWLSMARTRARSGTRTSTTRRPAALPGPRGSLRLRFRVVVAAVAVVVVVVVAAVVGGGGAVGVAVVGVAVAVAVVAVAVVAAVVAVAVVAAIREARRRVRN